MNNHEYKKLHEFNDYNYNTSEPYEKPARRSTEYLIDEARREADNTTIITNGGYSALPAEARAATERDILARRGFDNLVLNFQKRAVKDRKLNKILEKKYPSFLRHLSSVEPIPSSAATSNCIKWFQSLFSAAK